MERKIHVASIESLARLDAVLGEFAEKSSETLDDYGRDAERRLARWDEYCTELQSETNYWEDRCDSADEEEDDIDYLAGKLERAQEKLRRARHAQRRLEESAENFVRAARRASAVTDERLAEARAFLRQKIAELREYTAFRVENVITGVPPSSGGIIGSVLDAASDVMSGALEATEEMVGNLIGIALPKGFKWVRLDEISPAELNDLPGENEFRKNVSSDDMRRGFEILRRDILPVLKQFPEKANADYFERFDLANKRDLANSTKEIFNVFFGDEPIHLQRYVGGFYDISNGKHRIKIARELGWTAIPASVGEVYPKK